MDCQETHTAKRGFSGSFLVEKNKQLRYNIGIGEDVSSRGRRKWQENI